MEMPVPVMGVMTMVAVEAVSTVPAMPARVGPGAAGQRQPHRHGQPPHQPAPFVCLVHDASCLLLPEVIPSLLADGWRRQGAVTFAHF
ncbi:hypothetical protein D3C81_1928600 [compost metagenome]